MLTVAGGILGDRVKRGHWSLRGWVVKSAEHCDADYRPIDKIDKIDR